jgi:rhodanese-related sulfurtransferase
MPSMSEMPRKFVPPPAELVKSRIDEVLPIDVQQEVADGKVALIDSRDPARFETGHIPGAINVPAGENAVDAHDDGYAGKVAEAAGGKPVLVYCGTGNRSARVADALSNEHGVEGTRSLIGGIKLWDELGFPVEGTVEVGDADDSEANMGGEGGEEDTT